MLIVCLHLIVVGMGKCDDQTASSNLVCGASFNVSAALKTSFLFQNIQ